MKRLVSHLVIAGAAAAAGWYCGSYPTVEGTSSSYRSRRTATAIRTADRVSSGWAAQLPAVRAVPGSASEPAWIRWAMSIPDADIPAAISRLNTRTDFHALRFLYSRWTKLDPASAWASFRKSDIPGEVLHFYLPDEIESGGMGGSRLQENPRQLIASRMLTSWRAVDSAAARAFAARLADKTSAEARDVPMNSYYINEGLGGDPDKQPAAPEQLATAAMTRAEGGERMRAIANAAQKWLQTDARAACAWIRSLPLDERSDLWRYDRMMNLHAVPLAERVGTLVALQEGRNFSAETFAASQNLRPGHERYFYDGLANTSAAVRDWMSTDAPAAREWLATQPDSDLKSLLAGEAAAALARTDVNAAIAMLNETGGNQELAVGALMRGWMETDARAALAWAAKIDDAVLRDTSRSTAARQIAAADPALALETARTLTDPALRSGVFQQVRQSLSWNPAALGELQAKYPGAEWNGSK